MKRILFRSHAGIIKTENEWLQSICHNDDPTCTRVDFTIAKEIFEYSLVNGFLTRLELES